MTTGTPSDDGPSGTFGSLLGHARPHWRTLTLSPVLSLLASVSGLVQPKFAQNILDRLATGGSVAQGLGAIGRIEHVTVMPVEDDIDPALAARPASGPPPTVEVDGVDFAYADRPPVLHGVSFTVPGGTQTALVGLSGAGKTTLFSLLQRFYEPTAGCLRIGGQDIASLPRAEVRRRIAYVEQDAPALAGTLRDNLLHAAPDATDENIAEVLRATRLDGLTARLDKGLDTPVGARGITLSGGERQRLAIARALLRRPEVLLLDEATAQLDARNEQALSELVTGLARHCTVLLIAHRLSTVIEADQIVVLEHGKVRAVGSHRTLMDDDELYRELAATQLLAAASGDAGPLDEGV